jgi:hypothetical protein
MQRARVDAVAARRRVARHEAEHAAADHRTVERRLGTEQPLGRQHAAARLRSRRII